MTAATAIRRARQQAGISKRELARRAQTSPAAIVAYEAGTREPTFSTFRRIIEAAGFDAVVSLVPSGRRPDRATAARHLVDVVELAQAIPRRRPAPRELTYPRFGR
jgi:transcriptional regulator with XRE-family HTH domain